MITSIRSYVPNLLESVPRDVLFHLSSFLTLETMAIFRQSAREIRDAARDSLRRRRIEAATGHIGTLVDLAHCYHRGINGVSHSPHKAFAYWYKAGELGHASSMIYAGKSYLSGYGQSYRERCQLRSYGISCFEKVVNMESATCIERGEALSGLANYYIYVGGTPSDHAAALKSYEMAYKLGDGEATLALSLIYLEGRYRMPRKLQMAQELLEEAVKMRHPFALFASGRCHLTDTSWELPFDIELGMTQLKESIRLGCGRAMMTMGTLLLHHPHGRERAERLLRLAYFSYDPINDHMTSRKQSVARVCTLLGAPPIRSDKDYASPSEAVADLERFPFWREMDRKKLEVWWKGELEEIEKIEKEDEEDTDDEDEDEEEHEMEEKKEEKHKKKEEEHENEKEEDEKDDKNEEEEEEEEIKKTSGQLTMYFFLFFLLLFLLSLFITRAM